MRRVSVSVRGSLALTRWEGTRGFYRRRLGLGLGLGFGLGIGLGFGLWLGLQFGCGAGAYRRMRRGRR